MLENVGIKFNIGKKCWKMLVQKLIYVVKNLRKPQINLYIASRSESVQFNK